MGLTKVARCAIISKHLRVRPQYRGVEQLEARRAHNPEVVGSSPASATIKVPKPLWLRNFSFIFGVQKLDDIFPKTR